eukprot:8733015-Pyramimonas_sp.AAC.1
MRIISYNPLSASSVERLSDISTELRTWDVVLVCGTGEMTSAETSRCVTLPSHWCIRMGARKG